MVPKKANVKNKKYFKCHPNRATCLKHLQNTKIRLLIHRFNTVCSKKLKPEPKLLKRRPRCNLHTWPIEWCPTDDWSTACRVASRRDLSTKIIKSNTNKWNKINANNTNLENSCTQQLILFFNWHHFKTMQVLNFWEYCKLI